MIKWADIFEEHDRAGTEHKPYTDIEEFKEANRDILVDLYSKQPNAYTPSSDKYESEIGYFIEDEWDDYEEAIQQRNLTLNKAEIDMTDTTEPEITEPEIAEPEIAEPEIKEETAKGRSGSATSEQPRKSRKNSKKKGSPVDLLTKLKRAGNSIRNYIRENPSEILLTTIAILMLDVEDSLDSIEDWSDDFMS